MVAVLALVTLVGSANPVAKIVSPATIRESGSIGASNQAVLILSTLKRSVQIRLELEYVDECRTRGEEFRKQGIGYFYIPDWDAGKLDVIALAINRKPLLYPKLVLRKQTILKENFLIRFLEHDPAKKFGVRIKPGWIDPIGDIGGFTWDITQPILSQRGCDRARKAVLAGYYVIE